MKNYQQSITAWYFNSIFAFHVHFQMKEHNHQSTNPSFPSFTFLYLLFSRRAFLQACFCTFSEVPPSFMLACNAKGNQSLSNGKCSRHSSDFVLFQNEIFFLFLFFYFRAKRTEKKQAHKQSLDIELKPMGIRTMNSVSSSREIINFKNFKMCERFMAIVLDNEKGYFGSISLFSFLLLLSSIHWSMSSIRIVQAKKYIQFSHDYI